MAALYHRLVGKYFPCLLRGKNRHALFKPNIIVILASFFCTCGTAFGIVILAEKFFAPAARNLLLFIYTQGDESKKTKIYGHIRTPTLHLVSFSVKFWC